MATRHNVVDTDNHFIIDPITRSIINKSGKLVLIQNDHNSERFTFECPRYIDDHDMSLCDSIQIHYINTGNGIQKSYGIYPSKDIKVENVNGSDVVTFSWLVSRNATKYVGKLNFIVRFACYTDTLPTEDETDRNGILLVDRSTDTVYNLYVDSGELGISAVDNSEIVVDPDIDSPDNYYSENGRVLEYAWNTNICSDISIANGIYNNEDIVEEYVDILEMWKEDLYSEGLKISSIEQTVTSDEDEGINIISVIMTDKSVNNFQVRNGSKGDPGDAFTYEMFTPEQIEGLKVKGDPGDAFTYEMFTPEQIEGLKVKGDPGASITKIERTSGTGAAGTIDTYTITIGDGSTHTFTVYNGADGLGSGDMLKAIYDPQNKNTDVFEYVDDAIEGIPTEQSDWNQNDSSEPDFVKNRPFYTSDPIETVYIDNASIDFSEGMVYNTLPFTLVEGREYRVIWNGTEYIRTCYIFNGVPGLGNGSLTGAPWENTNEPFMFLLEGVDRYIFSSTTDTITVSLVGVEYEITKIDPKYLPAMVGKDVTGSEFRVLNETVVAEANSEIFNNYDKNVASGEYSHAEGTNSNATGTASHAEGGYTYATGDYAHTEGFNTDATGDYAHSEGRGTEAIGDESHAEGYYAKAKGVASHAEGSYTIATGDNSHVQGRYNIEDTTENLLHIVGNGSPSKRSNAHTVSKTGEAWFAGDVYVGSTSGVDKDEGSKKLVTDTYVDEAIHTGGITTAGDGAAYTATVPGITTLTAGASFVMIPHAASTTKTPTLNVNGLGAKSIKRQTSNVSSTLANGYADSWLSKGTPVIVIYNGTYWIIQGMSQTNPYDLSTAVPVTKGGTGVTSIEDTTYTTARYRASALFEEGSETDPTTNGVIHWTYK